MLKAIHAQEDLTAVRNKARVVEEKLRFSTDRLFKFLNALDRDVEIVIKTKSDEAEPAGIRVVVS